MQTHATTSSKSSVSTAWRSLVISSTFLHVLMDPLALPLLSREATLPLFGSYQSIYSATVIRVEHNADYPIVFCKIHWLLQNHDLTLSEGPASLLLSALSSASARAAHCRACKRSTLISAIVGRTLSGCWASIFSFDRVVVTPTTRMPVGITRAPSLKTHSNRRQRAQAHSLFYILNSLSLMDVHLPAALAACKPAAASSTTTQALGSTPTSLAAARKMSGAGFSRSNRSADTIASKSASASKPTSFRLASTCASFPHQLS